MSISSLDTSCTSTHNKRQARGLLAEELASASSLPVEDCEKRLEQFLLFLLRRRVLGLLSRLAACNPLGVLFRGVLKGEDEGRDGPSPPGF